MRKLILSVLFLFMPVSVWAWTTTNNFDTLTTSDGWYTWYGSSYSHPSITPNESAPGSSGKSFQITSQAGLPDSSTVGGISFPFPSTTNELWVQYYFKYSSNFQFHTVNNKQVYLWFGNGAMSGLVEGPSFGFNHMWVLFESSMGWLDPNTGYNPTINRNQWYKVVFHVKLVSPGNDVFQLWLDDGLVMDYSNTNLAVNSSDRASGLGKISIDPVWGGQGDPPKSVTDFQWYDGAIVSTNPIREIPGEGPIKIPSPPRTLVIR